MTKKTYIVDGTKFSTLAEAATEFTQVLGLTIPWNGNLDAFNDFLNGGFGTPGEGFILIWQYSETSKMRLGFEETLRWLDEAARKSRPSNASQIHDRIAAARRKQGQTLFETLVEIIRDHKDIHLQLK